MRKTIAKVEDIMKRDPAQTVVSQVGQVCRAESQYYCPREQLAEAIWSKVEIESPKSILIIDEPTLGVLGGYAEAKIVAALTDSRVPESKFATSKFLLEAYYNKEYPGLDVDVVRLTDILEGAMKMKHFDLVISNPPYGGIGTRITQKILDCVDYGEFVNLLPATNYMLSKTDLQKHVDTAEITVVLHAFEDAAVLPTISRVYKEEINDLTPMGFRIETQTDPTTKKYFWANVKRDVTYADMLGTNEMAKTGGDLSKSLYLPMRLTNDAVGGHCGIASVGPSKKTASYKTALGLISNTSEMLHGTPNCGTYVRFSTEEEKKNCGEFLFGDGFRFVSWLLNSMRVDAAGKAEHEFWLPRVDWRRRWTPREILEEYGYSEEEIAQAEEKLAGYPDLKE